MSEKELENMILSSRAKQLKDETEAIMEVKSKQYYKALLDIKEILFNEDNYNELTDFTGDAYNKELIDNLREIINKVIGGSDKE